MSLLRDAIRHSATGAVNAQGIANTRSSRAFRSIAIRSSRRPEPRVHLAEPRYPLPPGRANADFKAIIRGEWHPVRASAWIGCSLHRKLHRRTHNGVPPRRNREEYRAPNAARPRSPWQLKKTGSVSASLSPLASAPSPVREIRRLQCPRWRRRKSWERKPCSAKGRQAFPSSACKQWPAGIDRAGAERVPNESRPNR
jgi:hypothetical protein